VTRSASSEVPSASPLSRIVLVTAAVCRSPRMKIAISIIAFALLLDWIYVNFLTTYDYLGFTYDPDNDWYMLAAPLLVIISSLWLPVEIARLSHWILWLLFWLLYAPVVILVPLQTIAAQAKWTFLACLIVSFGLTSLCSRLKWRLPALKGVDNRLGRLVLWALYAGLFAMVLTAFSGHLQLVSFADVYTLRSENSDLSDSGLVGYALANLAWALNPYLIAKGLVAPQKSSLWIGLAGQVVLYSTLGQKGVLLSTVVVVGAYYGMLRARTISAVAISRIIVMVCAIPMIPILLGLAEDRSTVVRQLVVLVYMRTLGMTAAATGMYINFFQSHPFTYYSHINAVSLFVHYPYQMSLGQVVGFDLVAKDLNANANFYATDGYAALGAAGIVLIGPILGLFLSIANAMTARSLRVACAAFVPFVMIVSNSSLFTSLLSGGGFLLLLVLYAHGNANAQPAPGAAGPSALRANELAS
jgi:hypothetical protein